MSFRTILPALIVLLTLPALAAAQAQNTASIAGSAKDATGAVLPGVSVEAASPALIEKSRTVVTDGEGNYKIVDLNPGNYTVTFSLQGFATVKREGIQLTSGFTAAVNAELKVGDVAETITVTGETPVVDVQNARLQNVISKSLLDSAPTGRVTIFTMSALTLGMRSQGAQDVGGNQGELSGAPFYHGNNGSDAKYLYDGMPYNSFHGPGGGSSYVYRPSSTTISEVNLGLAGLTAEAPTGGVQYNIVPKDGGNKYSLMGNAAYTNRHFQADNLTDEIKTRGLTTVGGVYRVWDYGVGLGGPIAKDKLWFYFAPRWWGNENTIPGAFFNATQHTPFYTPDPGRPVIQQFWSQDYAGRIAWQASSKDKVTFGHNEQRACFCDWNASPVQAPEFSIEFNFKSHMTQATWQRTQTSRLLFQGGISYVFNQTNSTPTGDILPTDISTIDAGLGLSYRAPAGPLGSLQNGLLFGLTESNPLGYRASMSYVTGSHAVKIGLQGIEGWHTLSARVNQSLQYTFLNRTPISLTQYADPINEQLRIRNIALFAQDQWTVSRLTLNAGVRLDYYKGLVQDQTLPAGAFLPARTFAGVDDLPNFKDISPRLAGAYDVFGNGKTAIKGSIGRFVTTLGAGIPEQNNPALRAVFNTSRTWNDANGNYVPDCNLSIFTANGECGAIANNLFGTVAPGTTYDDNVLHGWGSRGYNWQSSVALQQELRPGWSVQAAYFHNWFGNFLVSVNQAVAATDFTAFCVTAPSDSRLPGGGGNQVCGNVDVNPNKFGQVQTFIKQMSALGVGDLSRVFNGIEFTVNGRFGKGGQVTVGVGSGQTVRDDCALNSSPQATAVGGQFVASAGDPTSGTAPHPLSTPYCHVAPAWGADTQFKLNGVYPLPWGFQVAGVFQNLPGLARAANLTYTNAQVAPALGRNLAAGPAGTVTIPILAPNVSFEDRLTQLDARVAKIFNLGSGRRVTANLDVYNLLNGSTITLVNNTYGARWLAPAQMMTGRYARFGAQIEF
jgi:hypothetical protein